MAGALLAPPSLRVLWGRPVLILAVLCGVLVPSMAKQGGSGSITTRSRGPGLMARLMASVDKQIDDEAGPSGHGLSDDKGTFQAAAQTPSQYVANQKLAQEAQQKSDKQRVEKEATSAMRDPAGAIAGEAGLEDAAVDCQNGDSTVGESVPLYGAVVRCTVAMLSPTPALP